MTEETKQMYEVRFEIAGPMVMAVRVEADSPEQAEWLAKKFRALKAATPNADDLCVTADRCVTEHLYQYTDRCGSRGKEMRCDKCGKVKWVPW